MGLLTYLRFAECAVAAAGTAKTACAATGNGSMFCMPGHLLCYSLHAYIKLAITRLLHANVNVTHITYIVWCRLSNLPCLMMRHRTFRMLQDPLMMDTLPMQWVLCPATLCAVLALSL